MILGRARPSDRARTGEAGRRGTRLLTGAVRRAALLVVAALLVASPSLVGVPAAAQTPISVSASPSSFQAPGTTTVTARIPYFFPEGGGPPSMTFTLTGPGGTQTQTDPSAEGEFESDPDGQRGVAYRYDVTFAVSAPGTHTIEATARGYGAGSTTVTVEAPPVSVRLVQDSTSSQVGQTLTLTATADNASSDGYWIVAVEGANAQSLSNESSANPLTVKYSGEVAGVDRIVATWVQGRQRPSDEVRHTWTEPPLPPAVVTVSVTPPGSSVVGTAATVTASVTGGSGEGYWTIDVAGANGPQRILGNGELPPGGRTVTAEYTGREVGTDTITATWTDDDRRVRQAQESVDHSWVAPRGPSLALRPESGSSLVGTPLELTLTVTGGEGRGPGELSVTVTGANAGVQPVVTGEASPFTVRYTGTRTGSDTITATWTDRFGPTTATATHSWTAPRVQLTAGGTAADLGDTATIRVALPDGSLGGTVRIEVLPGGPHAGPLEVTGSGNAFQASYTGRFPGTDQVRATLVTEAYGSFPSEVRTQAWNTPVVVLDQGPERSLVEETHTVTARVTGTRSGEVSFRVEGANAGVTVAGSGSLPSVTGSYTGRRPGLDSITAEVTVAGRRYASTPLTHSWVRPEVVLSQDTEVSKTGETVVLTATVAPSGIQGTVVFTIDGDRGPLTRRDDGADGSWTATYSRDRAGEDTITAALVGGSGGSFAAPAIRHRWAAVVPPAVVLSPAGATTCTGGTFSPTVTVTDEGGAVAQAPVRLVVTPGTGAPRELTGTTDVDGHVTLPHQGAVAGRDTLRATAVVDGAPVESAPLPHVWEDCELRVDISPPGQTHTVDSTFEPTVTVLDAAGLPVADARVDLQVTTPGQAMISRQLTTGPNGTVSTPYSRGEAGADRIDAVVTAGERTGRATAVHFWVEAGGLQVSLAPAGESSLTGSVFTPTVLVTDGQQPVEGARVTFTATMSDVVPPDVPDTAFQRPAVTGPDGQASVDLTREVAGTDTVVAEVVSGDRSGRASIVHFWQQVPGLGLSLEPAGESTVVDTDFRVTARVTLGGESAPGLELQFRATKEGEPDLPGSALSNADGRGSFTYRRGEAGPDVVAVSVVLPDGRRGQASIAHLWRSADPAAPVVPPPVDPALEVIGTPVPEGLVTMEGRGCPAGSSVQLVIDDRVVARTTARADGSYAAEVRLAGIGVGRHPLAAVCLPVRVPRTIDVVVPTASSGTAAAGTATAAAVLSFFVLLGGQLVRLSGGQPSGGS